MNATTNGVFGTEFMLAIVMAAFAFFAPQVAAEDESLLPAVDTSRYQEGATTEAAESGEQVAPSVTRDSSGSRVMDSIELGRTEITGNQELPKVLYIVPWQKSDPGDLVGRPINSLLDEVLAPIDREEFLRQVEYYDDLAGDGE